MLHTSRIALPGESAPALSFVFFDAATGKRVDAVLPPHTYAMDPIRSGNIWWSHDSRAVYIRAFDTKARSYSLFRLDAGTGTSTKLVDERVTSFVPEVFVNNRSTVDIPSTGEVLWYSQRDDFGHLYRSSGTGTLINRVTSGQLYVAATIAVSDGWVNFLAGREDSLDPYKRQLYRVRLDGSRQEQLTRDDADHDATASLTGHYILLRTLRLDRPVSISLVDMQGKRIAQLIEASYAADITMPERVSALGRDGRTMIFGTLFRPSNFDPAKRYPIIHYVYGNQQSTNAPLQIEDFTGQYSQALAELGFVVLMIDGMGTPGRRRSFNDVGFGANFKDCGLPDAIAVMGNLARGRPYLDTTSVGSPPSREADTAPHRRCLTIPMSSRLLCPSPALMIRA